MLITSCVSFTFFLQRQFFLNLNKIAISWCFHWISAFQYLLSRVVIFSLWWPNKRPQSHLKLSGPVRLYAASSDVEIRRKKKPASWGHQNLLVILEIFRSSWKRFFVVILHNSRGHGNTANEVIAAWAGWLVRGKRWHSCMPQGIAAQANVGITIVCTLAYWLSSGASCFCPMCLLSSQPGGDLHFTLGSLCTACVTYGRWVKNMMTCFQRRIFYSLTHVKSASWSNVILLSFCCDSRPGCGTSGSVGTITHFRFI